MRKLLQAKREEGKAVEDRSATFWRILHQGGGSPEAGARYADCDIVDEVRQIARPAQGKLPLLVSVSNGCSLGDALILEPALRALHEKYPARPLHVMTSRRSAPLFFYHPAVRALLTGPLQPKRVAEIESCYAHVYRVGSWLVTNPEALWKNAYEISCERLHVEWRGEAPRFHYTEEEDARVQMAIAERGVGPDNGGFVLLHPEASGPLRRWPREHALTFAEESAERGTAVVVAGTELLEEGPLVEHPRVLFTAREFAALGLRETLLLARHARAIVAVDSIFSHLAVSFDKPAVLLYGAFRPHLLAAKLCRNGRVLQHDLPCGPCHRHNAPCIAAPGAYASACMRALDPERVLEALTDVLDGKAARPRPLHEPPPAAQVSCPLCGNPAAQRFARKGDAFYLRCCDCGSLLWEPAIRGKPSACEEGPLVELLDVAELLEDLLRGSQDRTVKFYGHPSSPALYKQLRRAGWQCALEPEGPPATVVVWCGIARDTCFVEGWKRVEAQIRDDGLLVVATPLADYCTCKEAPALNTPVAGANALLPSLDALERVARGREFRLEYSSPAGTLGWQLMVWRKP